MSIAGGGRSDLGLVAVPGRELHEATDLLRAPDAAPLLVAHGPAPVARDPVRAERRRRERLSLHALRRIAPHLGHDMSHGGSVPAPLLGQEKERTRRTLTTVVAQVGDRGGGADSTVK